MRIALSNMWAAIQGYSRSTSHEIINANPDRTAESLYDANVFGVEITTAVCNSSSISTNSPLKSSWPNGMQLSGIAQDSNSVHDRLRSCITLAYVQDCLKVIYLPFTSYIDGGGSLLDLNLASLMPVLKPFAECYWKNHSSYCDFGTVTKDNIIDFICQNATDRRIFGQQNHGTLNSGIKLCAYAAVLKKDKSYFTQFANNVFLALLDRSAKVAGAAEETVTHKLEIQSILNQLEFQIDQNLRGTNTSIYQSSIPVTSAGYSATESLASPRPSIEPSKLNHDLSEMIGLGEVKQEVRKLINYLTVQKERKRHGLRESTQSLHYVFTGNPGTGKTTVARVLGQIFNQYGILKTPKVVECDRSALVGGFLGQTAIKTDAVIQSATDGVLFVDEAYSLAGDAAKYGHGDMYGDEAINTLLKRMEDYRDRLIVIAAGYPGPMANFIRTNPGLESRFTRSIHFEDYGVSEMCQIFDRLCRESQYTLTQAARAIIYTLLAIAHNRRDERFGNARYVRNVYEQTISMHSDRLVNESPSFDKKMLVLIDKQDIPLKSITGIDCNNIEFANSKWEAQCPGCGKIRIGRVQLIGQRVSCKCGQKFMFPWWVLLNDSVLNFPQDAILDIKPVDKLGIAMVQNR